MFKLRSWLSLSERGVSVVSWSLLRQTVCARTVCGGLNSGAFDSEIPGVCAVWGLLLNRRLAICSDRTAKYCFGVEGLEP